MGQTVNLLVYTFGGSNPSSPTAIKTMMTKRRRRRDGAAFLFARIAQKKIRDDGCALGAQIMDDRASRIEHGGPAEAALSNLVRFAHRL